jgi:hypothetical protein
MGVPKFPQLGLLQLKGPITLHVDLQLRWDLKQSYSLRQELSNGMSHFTCKWRNQANSWLLMVGNQIGDLTPSPSFGHNLCFKCPNGSCKPILDIYVPRDFQWYKELFNPLGFEPYNCYLKIWESTRTLPPKVGAPLGVWGFIPSHSLHSQEHEMWLLGFLLACPFAIPCLGHEPKVKVATISVHFQMF